MPKARLWRDGVIAARRRGLPGEDWLWRLLQRKTAKQAAIALANRMARTVWALLRSGTSYDAARAACDTRGHPRPKRDDEVQGGMMAI